MLNEPTDTRLRLLATAELTNAELVAIRRLMGEAFGTDPEDGFDEHDWQHSIGGMHFVLDVRGAIVSHASVVERELRVDGRPLRTGYVEAVATTNALRGRGLGSRVMRAVNEFVAAGYELGALGTSAISFYERLGWQVWQGPAFVRTAAGEERTPDDEGGILVLRTPSTPADLDLRTPISCDWRAGDVW